MQVDDAYMSTERSVDQDRGTFRSTLKNKLRIKELKKSNSVKFKEYNEVYNISQVSEFISADLSSYFLIILIIILTTKCMGSY